MLSNCKWLFWVSLKHPLNFHFVRIAFPELNWNCILLYVLFSMLSIIHTEKEEESLVVIYADDGTFSYIISEGTTKIYYLLSSLSAAKVDSEELSIYKKIVLMESLGPKYCSSQLLIEPLNLNVIMLFSFFIFFP